MVALQCMQSLTRLLRQIAEQVPISIMGVSLAKKSPLGLMVESWYRIVALLKLARLYPSQWI